MSDNLKLWKSVEKTNPNYTKKAKVGGNQITAISPQYQIMNATEKFGSYGSKWGFKNIEFDYSITNTPVTLKIKDWDTKAIEEVKSILGLVGFKATFFYPDGQFEITNSIKIFTDNKHSKIDDNFAKKLETDALTKALSKLGFNADIFLGKFDDVRYLEEVTKEFAEPTVKEKLSEKDLTTLRDPKNKKHIQWYLDNREVTDDQKKELDTLQKVKKELRTLTLEEFNRAIEAVKKGTMKAEDMSVYKLDKPQQKLLTEAILLITKD
jgi:integrase